MTVQKRRNGDESCLATGSVRRDQPCSRVRRSVLLKFLVLTMPSVLVAFVLCEVLVRYFNLAPGVHAIQVNAPRSAYKLSKNPILIYELKENYHDDNPDYFDRLPHTNSHGQRMASGESSCSVIPSQSATELLTWTTRFRGNLNNRCRQTPKC